MLVIMNRGASEAQISAVVEKIRAAGLTEHLSKGVERTIIGAIGEERKLEPEAFELLPAFASATTASFACHHQRLTAWMR